MIPTKEMQVMMYRVYLKEMQSTKQSTEMLSYFRKSTLLGRFRQHQRRMHVDLEQTRLDLVEMRQEAYKHFVHALFLH